MNSLNIRIGTYNIGVPFSDYQSMLRTKDPEGTKALNLRMAEKQKGEEYQALDRSYQTLSDQDKKAARAQFGRLTAQYEQQIGDEIERPIAAKLAGELDVICIQEVKKVSRAFLTTLKDQGFEIIQPEGEEIDTAIAVHKGIYASYDNFSRLTVPQREGQAYGEDIAGVNLTLKNGVKLAIGSLHTPGFALYRPGTTPPNYATDQTGEKKIADKYVQVAFETLNRQNADVKFMLGDMNNNPQNHAAQFSIIKKMSFKVMQPKQATDWNGSNEYSDRVLDFIFLKQQSVLKYLGLLLKSIFLPTLRVSATAAEVMKGYAFAPGQTCSDHLPVATVLHIETRSLLQRIGQAVRSFVGS